MKNLKHTITLIALLAFLFNYGQKNNPYNYVGVKHNQVLSDAYSQLSAMISKLKNDKSNGYKKINYKQFVTNLISENFNKSKNNVDISWVEQHIGIPPRTNPPFPIGTLPTFPEFKKSNKSSIYQNYLKDIYRYGTTLKLNNLSKMVNDISKTSKLTKKDKEELLKILAIAYNSAIYWMNNESKWESLGGASSKSPIGGIIGADIAGAVVGALTTGPGAGVVAAGSSAVAAGTYLGDWIF